MDPRNRTSGKKGKIVTFPNHSSFIDALRTDHPAQDRADKMSLYGWLIGDWAMQAVIYADDGTQHTGRGEIHFGWVLEGRAIQDVWILPGVFHGTTLRAPARPCTRQRHCSGGNRRRRADDPLELHRHCVPLVPLAGRAVGRPRRELATPG
jgi:hypothetical protein